MEYFAAITLWYKSIKHFSLESFWKELNISLPLTGHVNVNFLVIKYKCVSWFLGLCIFAKFGAVTHVKISAHVEM